MALREIPWLLLLPLLVAVTSVPCACEERARKAGSFLTQCYDYDPVTNDTEFRASLLPLLAALPSAAAPTGFAYLRSNRSAFVRGLCFGDATVPSECRQCLSIAARNLTSGCGNTTRRAGVWTDRCFLAYADTDDSSPAEDAFRSRVLLRFWDDDDGVLTLPVPGFDDLHAWLVDMAQHVARSAAADISGARMLATADEADTFARFSLRSTVHVLAQCARDRTEEECIRCLQDSAGAVDWDLDTDDHRDGGVEAAVVGFNCYLRFNVSTALLPQKFWSDGELSLSHDRSPYGL
ncbi:unnamed protein product [Alopecurus aequalis]